MDGLTTQYPKRESGLTRMLREYEENKKKKCVQQEEPTKQKKEEEAMQDVDSEHTLIIQERYNERAQRYQQFMNNP
jgi:hypothetical protein